MSNNIRALQQISEQASIYIPISEDLQHVPSYVSFNSQSKWHASAILSTALETSTLPIRLKTTQTTLESLEAILNSNGSQRIVGLGFSVFTEVAPLNGEKRTQNDKQQKDRRVTSDRQLNLDVAEDGDPVPWDMDLFPRWGDDVHRSSGEHFFSMSETIRTRAESDTPSQRWQDQDHVRQKSLGLPISQR